MPDIRKFDMIPRFFARFLTLAFSLMSGMASLYAQCPMCKGIAESGSRESGGILGSALNSGILYLFAFPYLAIAILGIYWYRKNLKFKKGEALRQEFLKSQTVISDN
jgi:hypothetical protein